MKTRNPRAEYRRADSTRSKAAKTRSRAYRAARRDKYGQEPKQAQEVGA